MQKTLLTVKTYKYAAKADSNIVKLKQKKSLRDWDEYLRCCYLEKFVFHKQANCISCHMPAHFMPIREIWLEHERNFPEHFQQLRFFF